ncbi:hypothetical protein PPL_01437 [Heterostelium album PN500]|uniref:F-box domain-containing protein n=1 Tax=Heterostelium pallidum (strain ATCC 26659 / Pp 5 / PN500) TaxID=670386 RepID=D3AZ97_HETP5|nr:hypothetical protein PPL_01437 [Heterostelium album PN500]EFA85480.1 hypothetical protein PPL_01437 [Heterostelium album PN500]|eukprot:XP_020437588.1 hypothetical protein PPL_01437 [Heterostelium album PN500]
MKSILSKLRKKTSPCTSPILVPASPQLIGLTKKINSPEFYSFSLDGSGSRPAASLCGDIDSFSLDCDIGMMKPLSLGGELDDCEGGAVDQSGFECFNELGVEVKMHIISFLSYKDLISLSECSKEMFSFTHDRLLWINLFQITGWELPTYIKSNLHFNLIQYYQTKSNLTSKDALIWKSNSNSTGSVPTKRYKHTSITYKHYVIFIGGQETNTKRFSEIIYYNTKTNTYNSPSVKGDIPNFSRHTSRVIKNKVFIFGGFNGAGTYYNLAIYNLESKRWCNINQSMVSGDIPEPRSNHTSAVVGNRYYIFSGNNTADDGQYRVLDDFFYLDTKTLCWHRVSNATGELPCGRGGHAMETIDGKIYLFGGGVWSPNGGWAKRFNDVYIYDPETNYWSKPTINGDLPVTSTFCSSFVYGRYLMLFGGGCHKTNRVTNTTYALDTVAMRWHKLQNPDNSEDPRPRDMASASIINNQVYLYGGYSSGAIDYCDHITLNFKPLNSY